MKEKKAASTGVGGVPVNRFTVPLFAVVAILHIFIVLLILDVNRSSTRLSDLMQRSGRYQIEATELQANSMALFETCNSYTRMPVRADGSSNVGPLGAYAEYLGSDSAAAKVLERFRSYDVSDEVFSCIEDAAACADEMLLTQLHAIALTRSAYPLPDEPELAAIPDVPLSEEELAMPPEARAAEARKLLGGQEYARLRYHVAESIDNCISALRQEFSEAASAAEQHVAVVRTLLWLVIIVIVAVLLAAFSLFYKIVVRPVRKYSRTIDENKRIKQVKAIFELRQLVDSYNNLWDNRNELEALLRKEAETDALTGLPNRFNMENDLIAGEAYHGPVGVLMFDVDFLKRTNDTKGHPAGDRLLRTAADCIRECFGDDKAENCYRIGGDEFVAILTGCSESDMKKRLDKFSMAMRRERISVSVGSAYEKDAGGVSIKELLEKADRQMYEQKAQVHALFVPDDAETADPQDGQAAPANRYDFLTGLPSITYFFALAENGRKTIAAQGGSPSLLYLDLSGMKYYNHKYGFAEGDKLLRSFAELLRRVFGAGNCCHIAADHFAALADRNGLEEKLQQLFREWLEKDKSRQMAVTVGIYPDWAEAVSVAIAYDRSKIACDTLKGTYTSGFSYYSTELSEASVRQQYVLENFEKALSEKWIRVYYQPIVRAVNSKICEDEALARWVDPVKGLLSPAEFIPQLEDAGLIYKLDLYVLDRILEDMQTQAAEGLFVVPHSMNLSRSDFNACDIVEEIRQRVDAAGADRGKICLEITESVIGSDHDFIKAQIERFQSLGFRVWMDDFGSGYSSLNVLQNIRFDLIKFDMNMIRKLDENEDGKIILTELLKMATALGVDTICEGVETEEQARVLQEMGCSKLQGYYYGKPTPFDESMTWHKQHTADGYENPEESAYYASVCGVNLFDLDVLAQDAEGSLERAYSTLPMGIIEIKGDETRFLRSNASYREFFKRYFGKDISKLGPDFAKYDAAFMYNVVKTCCEQGVRSFYDEKMPDGSVIHSFARRIGSNPVTGSVAVAVAVLSISEPDEGTTFVDIARALAADYYCMYVVDPETDRYVEYSSPVGGQAMAVENHGEDFFTLPERQESLIYKEDRAAFFSRFSKELVLQALDERGVFTATFRRMDAGAPVWVNLKITPLETSRNRLIVGISSIDAQMKQQEHYEKMQKERAMMIRVMALSDGYLSLYTVEPETGHYIEFTCSDDYATLGAPKEGDGFFDQLVENAPRYLYAEDREPFLAVFSKEKVLAAIREKGSFSTDYRILLDSGPKHVVLRIAPFVEGEETKFLVAVRTWRERRGEAEKK